MASKRMISYQWRLFLPLVICFWAAMIGMYKWQNANIRHLRDEFGYDILHAVNDRIQNALANSSYADAREVAEFSTRIYDKSEAYDPMVVRVTDLVADTTLFITGTKNDFFSLPEERKGVVYIKENDLAGAKDLKYLYYHTKTPDHTREVAVLLPYSKRLTTEVSSQRSSFWFVFFSIGLFITFLAWMTTMYFGRNLKILKKFADKALSGHDLNPDDFDKFPNDELGEISQRILQIYEERRREERRTEREHKVAINAIEEKNRMKRELTSNINHELKTPVGIVQGYIDTIVQNPDMDEEMRRKFMVKAQDGIHRLSTLIVDLSAITKLESGGKLVNVSEVNFHDFAFTFANYINEGDVLQGKMTFEIDVPLNSIVLGNDALFTSIFTNLVKNAVAYSEGTECRLVCTGEDEKYYHFRFYDNGVGVAPEHLPHLFERFYRVSAGRARSTGGTGLGLSIVAITIQSLGGDITVGNHFPSGLEFNFSLQKYNYFMKHKDDQDDKNDTIDKS